MGDLDYLENYLTRITFRGLSYKTYYGRNERSCDREHMALCYKTLITVIWP